MSNTKTVLEKKDIVVVRSLRMAFQIGKVEVLALRGVDMVIERGEFVAVMGPSGCGKSTLLHVVGGLLKPTSGQILIDGIDMSAISDAERTRIRGQMIGFVFQRHNLLSSLTARDNVELASQISGNGNQEEGVLEVLKMLGLDSKMDHKPSELSGGEQQRTAIARAVVHRPSILLADEPTGSLDSENSRKVLGVLQSLNTRYGQTVMMVTHDLEAAQSAHRIIEMRDGKIFSSHPGAARTSLSFSGSQSLAQTLSSFYLGARAFLRTLS